MEEGKFGCARGRAAKRKGEKSGKEAEVVMGRFTRRGA